MNSLSIKDIAVIVGTTTQTIRNLEDREAIPRAKRNVAGHRYYSVDDAKMIYALYRPAKTLPEPFSKRWETWKHYRSVKSLTWEDEQGKEADDESMRIELAREVDTDDLTDGHVDAKNQPATPFMPLKRELDQANILMSLSSQYSATLQTAYMTLLDGFSRAPYADFDEVAARKVEEARVAFEKAVSDLCGISHKISAFESELLRMQDDRRKEER